MFNKHDPNITARNDDALKVPCSYCGAKIGYPCWTLRSVQGRPQNQTLQPHKHRIKAAWEDQYRKRVRVKKKEI